MTNSKVHWLSIVNSIAIVLFLTGIIALILMRTLHRDLLRYNDIDDDEAQQEDIGWKLVHGDVFRPPANAALLSVFVGNGVQIALMAVLTMTFAVLGLLSPANRGSLMTALLLLFLFMGIFAGYYSSRFFKSFGLVEWRKNTLLTATGFPGIVFAGFFIINLFVWSRKSTAALPFGTMLAILVLWFGISVPLVYLGSYIGFKKEKFDTPVKTNQIPRQIPPSPWYMLPIFSIPIGGILPFGAIFVEYFVIMTSIWLHQFYYVFGFLFVVFFILLITCAEISIVMCYFQLSGEDYNWWWRSFFTSGSSAIYVFLYSALYFFNGNLHVSDHVFTILYFGYMALASFAFFLMTGTIGFITSYLFVKKIYGSIKVD
jgi:transmembrane 9 superfamily protein 2/4